MEFIDYYKILGLDKNATADDIFLVLSEAGTCEIINLTDNTLTLGGFNASSNSDYQIVYKKVE